MQRVLDRYVPENAKPVYYKKGARVAFFTVDPYTKQPVMWKDAVKSKVTEVFRNGGSGIYWITKIGIRDTQQKVDGREVGNKKVYEKWYKNECNNILMKQLAKGY